MGGNERERESEENRESAENFSSLIFLPPSIFFFEREIKKKVCVVVVMGKN